MTTDRSSFVFRFGPDLLALVLFALGTVVYTHPLITDFSRPFSAVGDYLLIIYSLSWQIQVLLTDPLQFFHANVMHPTASSLAVATPLNTSQLMFFLPAKLLTGDGITAINAVYFGNVFATAVSVYIVLRLCGVERRPAFVAGWAFGFAIGKMHQHFQFPAFWLVWTSYFWYGFVTTRQRSLLVAAALSFVFMSLGSFYLMYMGFLSLLGVTIVYHFRVASLLQRSFLTDTAVAALVVAVILAPFGLPYFQVNKEYGLERPMGEAIQYSADPLGSYLLPNNRSVLYNDFHPARQYAPFPGEEGLFDLASGTAKRVAGRSLVGDHSGVLSYSKFHSIWEAGWEERRLFPGFSVLLLAVLGLLAQISERVRVPRMLTLALLIVSVLLSCGPVLIVLGHLTYLPLPYVALYYIVPGLQGMRATARFGYVALMALAALAAIGWNVLERRMRTLGRSTLVVFWGLGVWLVLFTLENLPAERPLYERPPDPPPVYEWLARADFDGGVIEVPTFKGRMRKEDPQFGTRRVAYRHREYLYMYYSTYHWKPIYNGFGAFAGPHQFAIRDALEALPNREAAETLRAHGLTTIIAHTYWFEQEDIDFWARPGLADVLEEVAAIEGAKIYRIRPDPPPDSSAH